ncbi:hypothetical protein BDY24DRAFT_397961 [Mrakia frigida]|uniref:uncharacterized protein n=1 Tax=Mrakia frigida TaxID=29902 RepID=UPI003FCBF179
MIRRSFSLLLIWTPTVVVLSTLACTTKITRRILSTTVSNVLFLLDLLYLSLVASIALVIHTRFIPLQIGQPPSARVDSTALPSSSSTPSALLLSPPPSKLLLEEEPLTNPTIQNEEHPSLSRIPRRSKSQSSSSASIVPRRPPPPPPSPQSQPIPPSILSTQHQPQPQPQQHRVRFTSPPSSIALQDPQSRGVVSPLASQLKKTEEAFFPSTISSSSNGNGRVGDQAKEVGEEVAKSKGGKGKEREEITPMTPPASPEIELLGDLRDEEQDGMGDVVGGSGASRRRRAAPGKSTKREEDAVGAEEERGKDGLGFSEHREGREEIDT